MFIIFIEKLPTIGKKIYERNPKEFIPGPGSYDISYSNSSPKIT